MTRALRPFLYALAGVAAGLLLMSWLTRAWLGRWLAWGELAGAGAVLAVLAFFWVRLQRQRERRRMQDLRDSALW